MSKILTVELHSEWRSGTGRGKGLYVDAEARKDHLGLPIIPGRQLKGLLRHALETGAEWGHWSADYAQELCGSTTDEATASRFDTHSGKLSISSARMSMEWLTYFEELKRLDPEQATQSARQLFIVKRQTAINSHGLVEAHSLRSIEVCVPLTLFARIEGVLTPDELGVITRALKLIRAVGGHTTRGLGRATLSLSEGA